MSPQRVMIFGWDGADWDVIEEGWRRGRLQNLRRICDAGQRGTLLSTLPAVTPVAWTSFLTGQDPGAHGIFGFRRVDPATYRLLPVPGGARQVPTLFQNLDRQGIRTCLVTVPWTYPADALEHGAIVPGWDAPDEGLSSSHPAELESLLADVVDHVPRRSPGRSDDQTFLATQARNIELRERISTVLFEKFDPQVFMVVFTEPDQGGHHFWGEQDVPAALIDCYEQVDAAMGRLMTRFGAPDDLTLVVSDHGSRPLHTHVHVAELLASGGWLTKVGGDPVRIRAARSLKRKLWYRIPPRVRNRLLRTISRDSRRSLSKALRTSEIDWGRSQAFPVGDEAAGAGIRINVAPFARAAVTSEDAPRVRDELIEFLRGARDPDSGAPLFDDIVKREDVYAGPASAEAPELLLIPAPGYGTRAGWDFAAPISRVAVGGHRREGIFATDHPLGLPEETSISDILPRALEQAGLSMEITDLPQPTLEEGYTAKELEEMESRLRDLGYIE